ncbi:MAG: thioredoxin domain-containing protein [Candidatus Nealsonbacteria bacterium]
MLELTDENFKKEVLESKQLVLVDFWRPGCKACLVMDSIIKEIAKELTGKATVGMLNVFDNLETANTYKIPAVPTLIIFKDGKAIERAVGLRSKQALVNKLIALQNS